MATEQRRSNLTQFLLLFVLVYFGSQFVLRTFFPGQFGGKKEEPGLYLQAQHAALKAGNSPSLILRNETEQAVSLENRCPQPVVDVSYGGESISDMPSGVGQPAFIPLTASGTAVPCVSIDPIPAGGKVVIDLAPWKYSLFAKNGFYRAELPMSRIHADGTASGAAVVPGASVLKAQFSITEPGVFTKLFRTFISAPFLNFLIFIASITPGHNLGVAIIVLTLVVKLLLYIPTQHAMEGQKKMQILQPKLEELKRKYPNDPKKQQEETMKLWKEHQINPLSSCLPTLIQFPILIGLLYVIRDESHLELSRHLIYPLYQHLTWQFGTGFLGLELLKPDFYVMPILLVVLQYLQMKLAFDIADKKKVKKDGVVDITKEPITSTQVQQKVMLYGLPLMIGFFALQFPAAVALYWGVSTIFGIGQQIIVNREHLRV